MAGKGSKPRSCFSKEFRDNYDNINWGKKLKQPHDENKFDKQKNTGGK